MTVAAGVVAIAAIGVVVALAFWGNGSGGYQVRDDGQEVDCSSYTGSPSAVSVGHDIVSCGATAQATDVCWVSPDRVTLLCGWNPWDHVLHRNHAVAPVRSFGKPAGTIEPWGVDLDDGARSPAPTTHRVTTAYFAGSP